jgi:hypothetical protein
MFPYLLFAVAFLTFFGSASSAQDRPPPSLPEIVRGTNCQAVCGSDTCCIGRMTVIPVCTITGSTQVQQAYKTLHEQTPGQVLASCTKTNSGTWRGILGQQGAQYLNGLDCKWGCCDSSLVIAHLRRNPSYAKALFAGTDLEALANDYGSSIPFPGTTASTQHSLAEGKLQSKMESMKDSLCIFCCTF